MLSSSFVDRVFKPRSGQANHYEIVICCFFAKHTTLRRKSKDCLAGIMCLSGATCLPGFFYPALYINLTKRVGLVQSQTSFSSHHR